jgi:hypothetical protein
MEQGSVTTHNESNTTFNMHTASRKSFYAEVHI